MGSRFFISRYLLGTDITTQSQKFSRYWVNFSLLKEGDRVAIQLPNISLYLVVAYDTLVGTLCSKQFVASRAIKSIAFIKILSGPLLGNIKKRVA